MDNKTERKMREIKFRAWDRELKQFLYFRLNNFGIELRKGMNTILSKLSKDKDREDLQQFTGLKDKNGVEIYEGDIVRLNYAKGVDFICEIKYDKAGFLLGCCKFIDSYEWLSEHSNCENWCDYIEVIGNIYENE